MMLSALGFSYLMFLSGLEIDFDALQDSATRFAAGPSERLKSPLVLGIATFALTLAAGIALSFGLASYAQHSKESRN